MLLLGTISGMAIGLSYGSLLQQLQLHTALACDRVRCSVD